MPWTRPGGVGGVGDVGDWAEIAHPTSNIRVFIGQWTLLLAV